MCLSDSLCPFLCFSFSYFLSPFTISISFSLSRLLSTFSISIFSHSSPHLPLTVFHLSIFLSPSIFVLSLFLLFFVIVYLYLSVCLFLSVALFPLLSLPLFHTLSVSLILLLFIVIFFRVTLFEPDKTPRTCCIPYRVLSIPEGSRVHSKRIRISTLIAHRLVPLPPPLPFFPFPTLADSSPPSLPTPPLPTPPLQCHQLFKSLYNSKADPQCLAPSSGSSRLLLLDCYSQLSLVTNSRNSLSR